MDDIVELIKERLKIEDVIEADGFPLARRHGRYIRGNRDDCNSLVIDTIKQTYYWNHHSEGGDVITWKEKRSGRDFKGAVEELCRQFGLPEPKWRGEDAAARMAARKREDIWAIAQRVMQNWLWCDAEALAYCRKRGWTDETIKAAGLGFTGRDPAAAAKELRGEFSLNGHQLDHPDVIAIVGFQGDVQSWAIKWGVDLSGQTIWTANGFIPGLIGRKRLIYPHFVQGRVKTFSGRNFLGDEINKEGREVKSYNLPVALAGNREPFYNHSYAPGRDECVIVEGQADAITLAQWEIPAVALLGATHKDRLPMLETLRKRHNRLYWGLDSDDAGEKALIGHKRDWPLAGILGPMTRVIRWPECQGQDGQQGKDANDWLKFGMGALGLTEYQSHQEESQGETQVLQDGQGTADHGAGGETVVETSTPPWDEAATEGGEAGIHGMGTAAGGEVLPAAGSMSEEGQSDPLAEQAAQLVRQEGKASISLLQRGLKLGYPRAARLMDELQRLGVIVRGDVAGQWQVVTDPSQRPAAPQERPEKRSERLLAEQIKRARELLNTSLVMAEEMAKWAGEQQGADRDEAIKTAFTAIVRMDKVSRGLYRQRLCDLMRLGVREFDVILKASGAEEGGSAGQIVETLGGYIDGWLLEYCYDPNTKKARLAYRDPDRKIGIADFVEINGTRYVPRYVTSFVAEGGVLFAGDLGPLKSTRELVAIIQAFVQDNYLLESHYLERIIAYYVLLTWIYDCFSAICYLRAMGEAGAGKSELMRRVGHLCYRFLASNGASSASTFFRTTETYRGTVFIDEADLSDGGDMANSIVKFLNLGAMKGNMILRSEEIMTENGKAYQEVGYTTYCPKLIAQRKDFRDDAVGTRSLTIKVIPREPIELRQRNIKFNIDREMRDRALAIRNLLLHWRLANWEEEILISDDDVDLDISSRLNQVTLPIKAIAKDDPGLKSEIERFLRAYNQEMVLTRSMTIAARIVEAMWKIWQEPAYRQKYLGQTVDDEGWYVMVGDIATVANRVIDEMNSGEEEEDEESKKKRKKDSLTARGVGSLIRNELQLHVGERRGKGFPVFWDSIKMQALAKRYGVPVYDPDGQQAQQAANPPASSSNDVQEPLTQGGLL